MPSTRASGVEIHFEVRGEGPTLLMIPGWSLDLHVFDRLADRLAQRFTCVGMDNRGAGQSEAPRGPYEIRELARDAAAVLGATGRAPAFVLGHSMGGFAALELVLCDDRLVRGLLLVSTAAAGARGGIGQSPEVAAALYRRVGAPAEIARTILAVSLGAAFLEAHPEELERWVAGRIVHPPRGRGVAGQRAAADAFDATARLARIRVPTAIVHGDADRVVAPSCGALLAAGIPGASFHLLPAVGHMPFWEAPEALAAIAEEMLLRSSA
jgi:3-oxoadipate enol-lactonase